MRGRNLLFPFPKGRERTTRTNRIDRYGRGQYIWVVTFSLITCGFEDGCSIYRVRSIYLCAGSVYTLYRPLLPRVSFVFKRQSSSQRWYSDYERWHNLRQNRNSKVEATTVPPPWDGSLLVGWLIIVQPVDTLAFRSGGYESRKAASSSSSSSDGPASLNLSEYIPDGETGVVILTRSFLCD